MFFSTNSDTALTLERSFFFFQSTTMQQGFVLVAKPVNCPSRFPRIEIHGRDLCERTRSSGFARRFTSSRTGSIPPWGQPKLPDTCEKTREGISGSQDNPRRDEHRWVLRKLFHDYKGEAILENDEPGRRIYRVNSRLYRVTRVKDVCRSVFPPPRWIASMISKRECTSDAQAAF